MIATGDRALAVVADATVAIEICVAGEGFAAASVLGVIRNKFEFAGAHANGIAILDRALHVRAAQAMAFVDATAANAASTRRAFAVAVALTDRMASGRFGETSVAGRAFANVCGAGWTELAHSRLGAVGARIGQFASSIRNWISTIAGRALAHGRLVFGNANGVLAARQLIANVVAGVGETIT